VNHSGLEIQQGVFLQETILTALFINGPHSGLSSLIKKHKLRWEITDMVGLVALSAHFRGLQNKKKKKNSEGSHTYISPVTIAGSQAKGTFLPLF
jgi:hypothetical protein